MMTLGWNSVTLGWSSLTLGLVISHALAEEGYTNVRGAGASFPSSVYEQWIPFYQATRHSVLLHMPYDAIGSGGGKERVQRRAGSPVEYAGSDSILKEAEYAEYPDLQMFPTMAGAVVIAFNLPGVPSLSLTREALVGVYNGSITWWNDSRITAINADLHLPAERIRVVARADRSGTTEAFTGALSAFSGAWAADRGTFSAGAAAPGRPSRWPAGVMRYYGQTNRGMSGLLLSVRFTIGYISASDAAELYITTARLQNREGLKVDANTSSVQAAMDAFSDHFTTRMTLSLVNAPGRYSYPIAAYTYLIIYKTSMVDCASAAALYRYVDWFLNDPRAVRTCIDLNMVPLSSTVTKEIVNKVLNKMMCKGRLVDHMVIEEKYAEERANETWRTPLFASVPVAVFFFAIMFFYIISQEVKVNKAIFNQEYLIDAGAIHVLQKRLNVPSSVGSLAASGGSTAERDLEKGSLSTCRVRAGLPATGDLLFGQWDGETYSLQPVCILSDLRLLRQDTKRLLLSMRTEVNHNNIVRFYGVTELSSHVYMLGAFCQKGTLQDVIHSDRFNLDSNFKFSMALDVARGMSFLHGMNMVHGYLSTSACLIDGRWNVKVADWQLIALCDAQRFVRTNGPVSDLKRGSEENEDENLRANHLFWTAPELISDVHEPPTKAADVYSFCMVIIELFMRAHPFDDQLLARESRDIIRDIVNADIRPKLNANVPTSLTPLLTQSWQPQPVARPPFTKVIKLIDHANPVKKSVLDCMMEEMENYVQHLEEKVDERTTKLDVAMKQMEKLLHRILPRAVAEKLSRGETVAPESFDSVTIYFSDIVSFTSLASDSTPIQVVEFLNDLYTTFDDIIDNHDVYKVETIGDAYMCISGLPARNGIDHARHVANMALDIVVACGGFRIRHRPGQHLRVRIGVHSGGVVAGVVGVKMPRYCLFGDTVNTASRMETNSKPNKIHLSAVTKGLLDTIGGYATSRRAQLDIKGKGVMQTFWLIGRHSQEDKLPFETTSLDPGDVREDTGTRTGEPAREQTPVET